MHKVFNEKKLKKHSTIQEKHRKQRKDMRPLFLLLQKKTQSVFQLTILIYMLMQWKINPYLVMGG